MTNIINWTGPRIKILGWNFILRRTLMEILSPSERTWKETKITQLFY